jgi:hypothetical protein
MRLFNDDVFKSYNIMYYDALLSIDGHDLHHCSPSAKSMYILVCFYLTYQISCINDHALKVILNV